MRLPLKRASVGSLAFAVGGSQLVTNELVAAQRVEGSAILVAEDAPVGGLEVRIADTPMMRFSTPGEIEFGNKELRRFRVLAAKRALGTVTPQEDSEFTELQRARRASEPEPGRAMADYRRTQLMVDLLGVLKRHVRFFKLPHQKK